MEFTHYINDPDSYGTRALVFQAYKCDDCGEYHRRVNTRSSVMPWITAVTEGLTQLIMRELPPVGCPRRKRNG